jgi:hypothetical protein
LEETEFHYRRKPAFISFLPVYIVCFGIAIFLIKNSPLVSAIITERVIGQLALPPSHFLWNLPYGTVLSSPFLLCGMNRLLWNVMSCYEFSETGIRLLTGSLSRRERFFSVSDFFEVSFSQNLIETPFGAGSIHLRSIKTGKRMSIKGVYCVKKVVEVIRSGQGAA